MSKIEQSHRDREVANTSWSFDARSASELPKPKDWQAFQRKCVLLFRSELQDPNAQEYGRGGQKQGGIDILGRRGGAGEHWVGVQCRLVARPLKRQQILSDCRAALTLEANIKEIIFATTAPDDTGATDAALSVERTLRSEGYDLIVSVYGWGALQNLIALHDVAYNAFLPSVVATSAPQTASIGPEDTARMASEIVEQMREQRLVVPLQEEGQADWDGEDPALHAQIDTLRDMFAEHHQPVAAEAGLLSLLASRTLGNKQWALFRIQTNLGAIALRLGKEIEGAERYQAAYEIRPEDSKAIANLALARTIQGRYEEAMDLARSALARVPRADHAVSCLLQAAARSTWTGTPDELVPADLVGNRHADLGLAEFLRWRETPGWERRCLEISERHKDLPQFRYIAAVATLSLSLGAGPPIRGINSPISTAELNSAADAMTELATRCLDTGFANTHELTVHLNNAALLLRLCGRYSDCEALLKRGMTKVGGASPIRRLLAMTLGNLGRREEAIETLSGDDNLENRMLSAELTAMTDPGSALAQVLAIEPASLTDKLRTLRWRLVGEFALKCGNADLVTSAVTEIRKFSPNDLQAAILEIRQRQQLGQDESETHEQLQDLARNLPEAAEPAERVLLAEELHELGLSDDASQLLADHVDLSVPSRTGMLYLRTLAAARRDDAFRKAVSTAGPEVRDDPETLWLIATHDWNVGDLAGSSEAVEALLARQPNNPHARLLKLEILARQDRSSDLLSELEKPIEDLFWNSPDDQFRVAQLLMYFGHVERGAALAYRLFLERRDQSQAWMTLATLMLGQGRGSESLPEDWSASTVAFHVAIDVEYDDGGTEFFIVEPDAYLRRLDEDSWEPNHPFVRLLIGKAKGDRFTNPGGKEGTIVRLRHKYIARLHHVMDRHEERFPDELAIRKASVNPTEPGGLDELIVTLKGRRDWVQHELDQYRKSRWPIGLLAHRLGVDTIDAAHGLVSQGLKLKVAAGTAEERSNAAAAILENAQQGCVMDLLAFWMAWQLHALEAITTVCGPVHMSRSVIDSLRMRRERMEQSSRDGLKTFAYHDGKIALQEVAPDVVADWQQQIDRAIDWAENNANICPLIITDDMAPVLREQIRSRDTDLFHSAALAIRSGKLLLTDDQPTRSFYRYFGGSRAAWLHQVFDAALQQQVIDFRTFVEWSAHLISANQDYLGVSGPALSWALQADAEAGEVPGRLFKTLSTTIGGRNAEPSSHVSACATCLLDIWSDPSTLHYRKPATGHLLSQLLHDRQSDHVSLLRALGFQTQGEPAITQYIVGWARGHFITI